jgi:PIN domain nuclease of toxin-antitoxin system
MKKSEPCLTQTGSPFTANDALALEQLDTLYSHDPFDRALLAQALSRHLPFVTADEKIIELGLPLVIDARA